MKRRQQNEFVQTCRAAAQAHVEAKRRVREIQDARTEITAALEAARKRGAELRAEAVKFLRQGDPAKRAELILEADRIELIEVADLQTSLEGTAGKLREAAAQAEARAVELSEAELSLIKAARDRIEESVRGPLLKMMPKFAALGVLDQRIALRWKLPLTEAHVGNGRGEDLFACPWPERNVAGAFIREFDRLRRKPLPTDDELVGEAIALLEGE